jgi:hypothetical protein
MRSHPALPELAPISAQDGPVDTKNPPWNGPPPPPTQ